MVDALQNLPKVGLQSKFSFVVVFARGLALQEVMQHQNRVLVLRLGDIHVVVIHLITMRKARFFLDCFV